MNPKNTTLLREVLKPREPGLADVKVPAINIEPCTAADAVAHKAAGIIRLLAAKYTKRRRRAR